MQASPVFGGEQDGAEAHLDVQAQLGGLLEQSGRPYQSRRPGPVKVITETTRGTPNGHFRLHPGTGARNLLGLIRLQPNTWHPNLLGLTFRQGGTCQSRPSDTYPEPIQEDTPPFG